MVGPKQWTRAAAKRGLYNVAYVNHKGGSVLVTAGADGRLLEHGKVFSEEATEYTVKNPGAPLQSLVGGRACLTLNDADPGGCFVVGDSTGTFTVHEVGKKGECEIATDLAGGSNAWALACRFDTPSLTPAAIAGGDYDQVLILNELQKSVSKKLRCPDDTRCLVVNPVDCTEDCQGYVAAIGADGSVWVWRDKAHGYSLLPEPTSKFTLPKGTAPKVKGIPGARNGASWLPDGSMLAIPGPHNNVVVYNCMFWQEEYTLDGGHDAIVNLVSFSDNKTTKGLYAITAGRDKKVILWEDKKCIAEFEAPDVVSSLAWHPQANSVALICENGQAGIWENVAPSRVSPRAATVSAALYGESGLGDEGSPSSNGDEDGEVLDGSFDADAEHFTLRRQLPPLVEPQPAFQPGSTQGRADSARHFLCYNRVGTITSVRNAEAGRDLVVNFHDLSRNRKPVKKIIDYWDLSVASLSEEGAIFGSKGNAKDRPVLLFQPFNISGPRSYWTLELPEGEKVQAVAAGSTFYAAATSTRHLRIFTLSGFEAAVISLAGDVVALAASGSRLAAVWHSGAPTPSRDQSLAFAVFDVASQQRTAGGPMALTPASTLTWLAFSEAGPLATHDSTGVIRIHSPGYGGSWVPVFRAADMAGNAGNEVFWPVGLNQNSFFYIACPKDAPWPKDKPVQLREPLRAPILGGGGAGSRSDAGKDTFDKTAIESQVMVLAAHMTLEQGLLESSRHTETDLNTALHQALMRLFNESGKRQDLPRCTDILQRFTSLKWMQKAHLQATKGLKDEALAEVAARIIARKKEEEEQAQAAQASEAYFLGEPEPEGMEFPQTAEEPLREREDSPHMSLQPSAAPAGPALHAEGFNKKGEGNRGRPAESFVRAPLLNRSGTAVSKENCGPDSAKGAAGKRPAGNNPFAARAGKKTKP